MSSPVTGSYFGVGGACASGGSPLARRISSSVRRRSFSCPSASTACRPKARAISATGLRFCLSGLSIYRNVTFVRRRLDRQWPDELAGHRIVFRRGRRVRFGRQPIGPANIVERQAKIFFMPIGVYGMSPEGARHFGHRIALLPERLVDLSECHFREAASRPPMAG